MPAILDLSGSSICRVKVVERSAHIGKRSTWLCLCECGNNAIVRTEHLRGNRVRSCGCLKKEGVSALTFKHGQARKGETSVEFTAWCSAKRRCYDTNADNYARYGGRGIRMCEEWLSDFSAFFAHVGPKPHRSMSLDRIEVNGDYEPGNVRWATPHEQRVNQRRMK